MSNRRENSLKLSFCLPTIMIAGALTVSGSLADEAVRAPKETTTASPSTHAGGQGSHPSGGTAISAHGSAIEGSAGSKGTADNAGAKGRAGGNSTGSVREKAGAKSIGSARESGPGANPIDTRISVQPGRAVKKPPLGSEKKANSPAAPSSVNSARQTIPHDTSGSARNAIGVPLDNHAGAKGTSPGPQGHGPAAADGAAKNVIGAPGSNNGNASGANIVRQSSGPAIAGSTPHNRAVITGTGMSRPGSGPGTLGGAAKNAAAINGTNIRPKQ
jgi:hypothetical protein